MNMPKFLEKQRYNTISIKDKQYKIDTFIFLGIIGFLLIWAIIILAQNDFDKGINIYINCTASKTGYCYNPFYMKVPECRYAKDIDLCNMEKFPEGFSYGNPPPAIIKDFIWYGLTAIIIGLLLNHLLYNRKFKLEGDEDGNLRDDRKDNG